MSSLGPGVPAEKQLTGFDLPVLQLGMGGSRKFKSCRCETSLADEWPVSRRGHWQRGQDTWQGGVEYEAGSRGSRDRSRGSQSLHLTLGGKLVGGWSHAGKSPAASSNLQVQPGSGRFFATSGSGPHHPLLQVLAHWHSAGWRKALGTLQGLLRAITQCNTPWPGLCMSQLALILEFGEARAHELLSEASAEVSNNACLNNPGGPSRALTQVSRTWPPCSAPMFVGPENQATVSGDSCVGLENQ